MSPVPRRGTPSVLCSVRLCRARGFPLTVARAEATQGRHSSTAASRTSAGWASPASRAA